MKHIQTYDDFMNEAINEAKKVDTSIPDLPVGKVWRATKDFNGADLAWETITTSWIGQFRRFNRNTDGIYNYDKGQPLVINNGKDLFVSMYKDSSNVFLGSKYTHLYSNNKWDFLDMFPGVNNIRQQTIFLGLRDGYIKMDNINHEDEVSMIWSNIADAQFDKKHIEINGIEITNRDDAKFDYDRGYVTLKGFNADGKREETLIRDLTKAKIEIK